MAKRIGKQTILLEGDVSVECTSSVAGPMEGEGPIRKYFDCILEDDTLMMDSYEKAESAMLKKAYEILFEKTGSHEADIFIGGDLLNQIAATTFAVKDYDIPFWGVYNACASFSLAIETASVGIESGAIRKAVVSSSSHFSSVERQFRTPLELGTQPSPTQQRTVTGAGSCMLRAGKGFPRVKMISTGRVIDMDENDPSNMGQAMAPAAVDTISSFFTETATDFGDYDAVFTGDLSIMGLDIAKEMLEREGYRDRGNFFDCGDLIYDREKQNVGMGGSGAGCSSCVFCSYIYRKMRERELNRVLFVPTGALLSSISTLQKQSIPAIAHAVFFENGR